MGSLPSSSCIALTVVGLKLFLFWTVNTSVLSGLSLFILYHAFLFEMDITDLKNGHVIPKFWVLENFCTTEMLEQNNSKVSIYFYFNMVSV